MIARSLVALGLVSTVAATAWAYSRSSRTPPVDGRLDRPALPDPPAVLVFTSTMCLACERTPGLVAEALGTDEERLRSGQAAVGFAELDVADHAGLAEELAVAGTPTIVGLGPGGEIGFVHEANPPVDELAEDLANLGGSA